MNTTGLKCSYHASVLALLMLATGSSVVHAQANGDPGAAERGQSAANHVAGQKDGANAMKKGASGGSGAPNLTEGGSNSLSGSGVDDAGSKR